MKVVLMVEMSVVLMGPLADWSAAMKAEKTAASSVVQLDSLDLKLVVQLAALGDLSVATKGFH
jgi:hypothetical protein